MDKSLLGSYDVISLITVLRSLSTLFEDERAQMNVRSVIWNRCGFILNIEIGTFMGFAEQGGPWTTLLGFGSGAEVLEPPALQEAPVLCAESRSEQLVSHHRPCP